MTDPTWFALSQQYQGLPLDKRWPWVAQEIQKYLGEISGILDSNVLVYFSAFMQNPNAPGVDIEMNDINGLMNALYTLDGEKPISVIMHTAGGNLMAAELITEYIHCKFDTVQVIVPTMAMSAGTMFSLSCDKIIISKAGQLGPIDPQIWVRAEQCFRSSPDIIRRYKNIKNEILQTPHLSESLSSLLAIYGSVLLEHAIQSEAHVKNMVSKWLKSTDDTVQKICSSFYDEANVHSQCIGYLKMKDLLRDKIELLEEREDRKDLQSPVLGVYHLSTLCAENTEMTKMIVSNNGQFWIRTPNSIGTIYTPGSQRS